MCGLRTLPSSLPLVASTVIIRRTSTIRPLTFPPAFRVHPLPFPPHLLILPIRGSLPGFLCFRFILRRPSLIYLRFFLLDAEWIRRFRALLLFM